VAFVSLARNEYLRHRVRLTRTEAIGCQHVKGQLVQVIK